MSINIATDDMGYPDTFSLISAQKHMFWVGCSLEAPPSKALLMILTTYVFMQNKKNIGTNLWKKVPYLEL